MEGESPNSSAVVPSIQCKMNVLLAALRLQATAAPPSQCYSAKVVQFGEKPLLSFVDGSSR